MKTSEAVDQIFDAMAKAQAAFKMAKKDSVNPHFKSRYADFASVLDACRDGLTANKLTVFQDVTRTNGSVEISTRIGHSSGQWIEFGPLSLPLTKPDAQGVGSCTTYGRRYALSAALGLASEEDDDANAAVSTKSQAVASKIPPTKEWHPVDGPPPPSDDDRPYEPDDNSARLFSPDGSYVDSPVLTFGMHKGKTLAEVDSGYIKFLIDGANKELSDKSKAKFHKHKREQLATYEAELARRGHQ